MITYQDLTAEQKHFIDLVEAGNNVLTEACIGSGKTTAIQILCQRLPPYCNALYLTYNRLLKYDAKSKIIQRNVRVTNYHGFAFGEMVSKGVFPSAADSIRVYLKDHPPVPPLDILVMDEYQDINSEIAEMLKVIVDANPGIQIVAVGDMAQKISDNTTIDANAFIHELLGDHAVEMEFTTCFRLNARWASELGEAWDKKIVGVNPNMRVDVMSFDEAFRFLCQCEPKDIICIGSNEGQRNEMLNRLETVDPARFNKHTVWSKVTDKQGEATGPTPYSAVFTTMDGCKGMERKYSVVFDWTEGYLDSRLSKPGATYEILRNIMCVAASRGSERIIFVRPQRGRLLTAEVLSQRAPVHHRFENADISTMFDYGYEEHKQAAMSCLQIRELSPAGHVIDVSMTDGLVDLSVCIGSYVEMNYFANTSPDRAIAAWFAAHKNKEYLRPKDGMAGWTVDQKVLFLTRLETGQLRYSSQVRQKLVPDEKWAEIEARLAQILPRTVPSQQECSVQFYTKANRELFAAKGFADVILNNIVYELKFTSGLATEHCLQCAMYVVSRFLEKGILWNVRTGQMLEIRIKDRHAFLANAAKSYTKGSVKQYFNRPSDDMGRFIQFYGKAVADVMELYYNDGLNTAEIRNELRKQGLFLPGSGQDLVRRVQEIQNLLLNPHGSK